MMTKKGVLLVLSCLLLISLVAGFQYTVSTQSEFDQGTYIHTFYNSTNNSLQLSPGNTTGTYLSIIFDGLDTSQWNTLTLTSIVPVEPLLVVVDNRDDIWNSRDGVFWNFVVDDYNSGNGGDDAQFAFADFQEQIYSIEDDDDVWVSTTRGLTWTKANDDYNGEGQHVVRAAADYNNYLYIIEDDEDVWKSTDSGVNWTKINGSDFNGGNGDVVGLFGFNSTTSVSMQARSCALSDCSDASFSATGSSLNLSQNRYFQFNLTLTADESDITPSVSEVIIDYVDVGVPNVANVLPQNANFTTNESIALNATISDGRNLDVVLVNITLPNGTSELLQLFNTTDTFYELSYNTTLAGDYSFMLLANDTSNNLNDTETGSFSLSTPDVDVPLITLGSCTPNPSTIGEEVICTATITDNIQIATVLANITLPDTTVIEPTASNASDLYQFTANISLVGDASVFWFANDSAGNEHSDGPQAFTVAAANQSSGSGSQSSPTSESSSSANIGDSGPDALRNAPPGTLVIGKQPQPKPPTPSPSQGATIVQQPRTPEANPLTGAAIGASSGSSTFKKITALFLILALLFFGISYILRERRVATKHLYMKKLRRKIMVKDPQLLDKLQGYVSAEVLSKLKKGDNLQQKRVDPKDKEFAHQFPETAKELQENKIQVNPKKFNYERLEQVKKDIFKEHKSISATDMRKIFPETLGKTTHLQQDNFVFTPRTKDLREKVVEEDFTKYYDVKTTSKQAPVEQKQAPQTSRKINKTSKDTLLKELQEVFKIE